ncbi:MAG TPA: DMT family transporter [Caldilineaceae bacterium]|nr:DMT family transporter [Caldilineaceae bacterium]
MDPKASPYVLALGLAWGLNLVLSRFGIREFDPYVFIGLRLMIATAIFAGIYAFSPRRQWSRSRKLWRDATIVGIFGTALPFAGFVGALQFQSAGLTALLVTTGPAIVVTVAHFFLADARLTRATVIGVLTAFSGAVLIIALGESGLPDVSQANPLGYLMVFVALLSDAFMAVFIRKKMQGTDVFDVTSIRLAVAAVVIAPLALWLHPPALTAITVKGWGSLLFTATISTVVAQLLAFYITRTFGTTTIAMVSYVVPLVAILFGVLLLGETITWGMATGMVLIVIGVLIVNRRRTHPNISPAYLPIKREQ